MNKKLYQKIAILFNAMQNCKKSIQIAHDKNDEKERINFEEWFIKHQYRIEELTKNFMPSGSGIDNGTKFNFELSKPEKLFFNSSFHHMDEMGGYDGWTDHNIIVTPSLQFGIEIRITGRDKNMIKDYLYDIFYDALNTVIDD
jgi:hypothetical protein